MSSIILDQPHIVHTGAACMACCHVAPGKLLRCGACNSAWYCNQDCQRKNFKEHKPFCKALRVFHTLQADLPPESWPQTARDFYLQRNSCQRVIEPMLRRPLSRAERRAILGEAKCSVCLLTRAQLAQVAAAPSPSPSAPTEVTEPTAPAATAPAVVDALAKGVACVNLAITDAAAKPAAGPLNAAAATRMESAGQVQSTEGETTTPADGKSRSSPHGASCSETGQNGPNAATSTSSITAAATAPCKTSTSSPVMAQSVPATSGNAAKAINAIGTPAATPTPTAAAAAATALTCCPRCHWGWVCDAHRDAYLAGPHAAVCLSYSHMNESQFLAHRYLQATGRLPNYVPDKLRPLQPTAAGAAGGLRSSGLPMAAAAVANGHGVGGCGVGMGGERSDEMLGGWEPLPAGWAMYQVWRPLPSFDQATLWLLTKRMSQALTVVQALQHHYSPSVLAAKQHLEIHVLGASSFEVPADRIWEEILNLLPPLSQLSPQPQPVSTPAGAGTHASDPAVAAGDGGSAPGGGPRVLHIAFVGPELDDIILEESDGRAMPQGTGLTKPPPPPGREMLYSYHLCTYQEFASGRRAGGKGAIAAAACAADADASGEGVECVWRRPDLAVAFNSGISELDQVLWAPALEVLVRHGVPVVFTSYTADEAAADAEVWRRAGGEVTLGPEPNPYRALEPIMEPSQVDAFYYQNNYWWCGQASGGDSSGGIGSSSSS